MPPKAQKAGVAGATASQAVQEVPVTITAAATAPPAAAEDTRAVSLVHRHVFGLKSNVKGNVHFVNEKDGEAQILYPAGHNSILYQADQKVQSRVFPGTEGSEGISALAVSPNRKFLAVCERFQDRASCAIYDVNSGKRRRGTLTYAECDATEYVCAAFSAENKFLITQGGPPDWTLVLWSWDKARSHGSTKVSNLTGSAIHECSFSPQDSSLVCVIGDGVFKFFRIQEGNFKPIPNQLSKLREANNQNYVCHAWLHCERLVVCSESGDALLFDGGGEFKMVLPCSPAEPRSMLCVAAFSRGFVAGGDGGMVRVYERLDNDAKEMFRKTKEVKLDGSTAAGTGGPRAGAVTALAVSPQEEMLAIATSTAQLLQVPLSASDLLKAEESAVSDILTSFHSGPILGLDVCVRKPLVVTCGSDKSVRIWNYVERSQEQCKFFLEEAFSVAFHPSGFHLIIGFSDKLRLMNLLMEDMRTYKEIPIKACRECRFSHGGQFFAAVNSNTIVVYKTYTCEVVCNLRGHQSKVRSVCWTADDSRIVSTGADGAACEFDVVKGHRCSDWSQKGTNFSCVIAYTNSDSTSQVNTMYVVGSDKMLKEVQDSQLTNYLESSAALGQLALAASAKALIAGVAEPEMPGPLRCFSFPLEGDYAEYQAHSAPVSRLRITHDDLVVLSAGDDGCLCILDVKKKAPMRRDKEPLGFADEILVTRAFLDDKQTALQELERSVEELKSKIDFQLRHKDSDHKEQMAVLQEKYSEEIEGERRKYEVLREQKLESEMEFADKIRSFEDMHATQTQELEQSFQQKMLVEVQRYQKLAEDLERERQEWETQRDSLKDDHKVVVLKMIADCQDHEQRNRDDQDRIIKERDHAFKTHSETLAQLEKDADREIEELKEMYEQRLATEKDEKVRLRGQAGIHRKHFEELKRQWKKKIDDVAKEENTNRSKDEKIVSLMKDKDSNEKEIKERDKTIYDKEMRINDLKKQNQELEKFKFVLDYKIKELKAQIDPKTGAIDSMKKQTQAMDDELNDYIRRNKQLALDISQLQMKQRALQEEIKAQKRRLRDDWSLIKRFKFDLSECMDFVGEPKALKESVAGLYRKHVQLNVDKLDLDTDMQAEYNRQRDYLEKSVDSLKRKLEKDSQAHRIDNMRIMQENVTLITEINHLRREINALRHDRTQQETQALGGSRGDAGMTAAQADRELAMQREEIKALQHHLNELEMTAPRVPSAGGKLPQGALPVVASPLEDARLPENTVGQPDSDPRGTPLPKELPPATSPELEDREVEGGDRVESSGEGHFPAEPSGEIDGDAQASDMEPTGESLAGGPSDDDAT